MDLTCEAREKWRASLFSAGAQPPVGCWSVHENASPSLELLRSWGRDFRLRNSVLSIVGSLRVYSGRHRQSRVGVRATYGVPFKERCRPDRVVGRSPIGHPSSPATPSWSWCRAPSENQPPRRTGQGTGTGRAEGRRQDRQPSRLGPSPTSSRSTCSLSSSISSSTARLTSVSIVPARAASAVTSNSTLT